ncbi:MAG: InlB B-repeat-containing protein, partial [Eubacteriales bacterium]|nr:InlB B-repeat-containing protein [Eubacteriales bacterium]
MKLNFRRFVAILLVAMMTLTALPTAGIAEVMQDVSRESGSIRMLMVEPDAETYYTYKFYDEDGTTLIASQIVKNGDTLLEPAAPAKDNRKFERWEPQVLFGPVSELADENKTIKVTAKYTEVYYVFFKDNTGRVVKTKEAANGEPVTTADVQFPVETDHAITGWYTDEEFNNPVTTVTIDKANVTLYAKVEAGHWLTFDSKGGSYVAPVFVPNGKTATQPADPTRPGYTFDGWDFDFTKELTANATATAKWTVDTHTRYTVIHWQENADDNEYSYVENETKYGKTAATTAATAKSYTGFTAQTITQQTIAGDGSTIVNVYYTRNVYSVKFYNGNGTSEYTEYRITAKYGANIRKQWPGGGWYVSKSSYDSTAQTNIDVMPLNGTNFYGKQDGYYESTASYYIEVLPGEESSGTRMSNGKYYKLDHQDTTNSNGGLTVTDEDRYPMTGFTVNTRLSTGNGSRYNGAKFYYDRDEVDVVYIDNGTTVNTKSYKYQQDISDAENYTRPDTAAPQKGFTFAGWYADADGKVPYVFTGKKMPAQNITVYAKWEAPTYTITFYKHDGEEYGLQTYVKYGEKAEYDENEVGQYLYTPKGYEFLGWVQEDGTPFNFETKIYRDYKLYAKVASKAAYSVTYDANGGSGDVPVDGQKYAEGALADVKPADGLTPPQGKIFLGWSTNPEATTAEVYPYGKLTIGTADVILYAIWGVQENTVAITYNGNGGERTDGQKEYTISSLSNNDMITVEKNTFAKAGYKFVSWNTKADGTGTSFAPGAKARVNSKGENVLYAIWEARTDTKYIVEFYYQNTDGTYPTKANESVERQGTTDAVVEVEPEDKNPRENNKYVWDNAANNIESGTVSAVKPLVLKLYFKLNTAQYTIHHYLKDTEIKVAKDQTGTMQIGTTLTAAAAPEKDLIIKGVKAEEPFGSITINADPTKNVITVYYTKDVTFTGQSDTLTYTGEEQERTGIKVEGLLDGDTWTGLSYSAKGIDVGDYPGAFTGELKIMHAGKEATYYNVTKTPGELTITANTDEVTVTITGNTDTQVYNGSEQSVTGYTTDVGSKTIDVALKEAGKDTAKGTDAGKYYMGLTKEDFTVTSANYSNIKVVVVDGYLEITPITDEVTVTITGNHDSKVYNGSEQSVTGYTTDVGSKPITVALKEGSKAEAKGTDADHYPMGLTANDFTVISKNYSNIKVVVVDGYLDITPITDEVVVTITGNTDTQVYNATEQSVTGYTT